MYNNHYWTHNNQHFGFAAAPVAGLCVEHVAVLRSHCSRHRLRPGTV